VVSKVPGELERKHAAQYTVGDCAEHPGWWRGARLPPAANRQPVRDRADESYAPTRALTIFNCWHNRPSAQM
jgi:hypothetical protein